MVELQDIFNTVTPNSLSKDQWKAYYAIKNCRTEAIGSHVDHCKSCGHIDVSYNSCRNRHCPKCQGSKQREWVNNQLDKLLSVNYYHVVFTLPQKLNAVIYQNQKVLYDLLLKTAGNTIMELTKDRKYLGAKTGVTTVLHTWGQNLSFHPHVHCIVPGGGLTVNNRFIDKKKFFIPVKVLSRKFRGKFLFFLKKSWKNNELKFYNEAERYSLELNFLDLLDSLYNEEWVSYCKKPFCQAKDVVSYLGHYTHRVAISNSRLLKIEDGAVTFRWKDYRDKRVKLMKLDTNEFVRRFLLHILPSGFKRIRHYGLLAGRNIKKLVLCMKLTKIVSVVKLVIKGNTCPICGSVMVFSKLLYSYPRGP